MFSEIKTEVEEEDDNPYQSPKIIKKPIS